MHVAIVGAGALGCVYGVRLRRAGADVTLVVRPGKQLSPLRIERVDGEREVDTWDAPATLEQIPAEAEVVLLAVRCEQLDRSLEATLDRTTAPIVVLTPMMPDDASRLLARYGPRLTPAMVGVVAYARADGVVRYWLPRSATTTIDREGAAPAAGELVAALDRAGIRARLTTHVLESNLATTLAIVPAAMAIDVAGGIDALVADRGLRDLAVAAIREGLTLSAKVGEGAAWLGYLKPFVGGTMLRVGASLGKSRSPEAFAYVEGHFGRKLHAQNVRMGKAAIAVAKRQGTSSRAMEGLLSLLSGSSS